MSHNLALTPIEMWSKYQFDKPSLPCAIHDGVWWFSPIIYIAQQNGRYQDAAN